MAERDLSPPTITFLKLDTSGLYRADKSIDDPAQPWAMQIAAAACNASGWTPHICSFVIKANGRTALDGAVGAHGLTPRLADQAGIREGRVLGLLTDLLKTTPPRGMKVVTFGDFDTRVVASLLARFATAEGKPAGTYDRLWLSRPLTEFIDLQKPYCQVVCKLPSEIEGAFKWPSLEEAATMLLGRGRGAVRNAFEDLLLIRDLYFELKRLGYVDRTPTPEAA